MELRDLLVVVDVLTNIGGGEGREKKQKIGLGMWEGQKEAVITIVVSE